MINGNLLSTASVRKAAGSQARLFQITDSPNETLIVFKWDNIENVKKFTGSDDLKKTMEKAGVIGKTEIYFIE